MVHGLIPKALVFNIEKNSPSPATTQSVIQYYEH